MPGPVLFCGTCYYGGMTLPKFERPCGKLYVSGFGFLEPLFIALRDKDPWVLKPSTGLTGESFSSEKFSLAEENWFGTRCWWSCMNYYGATRCLLCKLACAVGRSPMLSGICCCGACPFSPPSDLLEALLLLALELTTKNRFLSFDMDLFEAWLLGLSPSCSVSLFPCRSYFSIG